MAVTDSSVVPRPRSARAVSQPTRHAAESMSAEELAATLDRLRPGVVAAERWAFSTSLAAEDIENLYSDACVDALRGTFTDTADVAAYVRRHVHNRAISLKASPSVARRAGAVTAEDRAAAAPGPHDHAVTGELVAVLYEFIAEQSPQDRQIAWLLANGERPAQIARALRIPGAQATVDCKRLRSSLDRFVALQTRPAAICARRREDVAAWQQTGRMPLALRWHLRWHHGCALAVRDARQAVQHALLPLGPAAAAATHAGLVQQVWQTLVTNRVMTAAHDAMARARRLAPAGGGSAAAGAGVVKAIAVVGAGVAAVHAIVAPAVRPRHSHPRVIVRAAATSTVTTPAPVVVSTPTTPAPVTTTTSSPSTTTTTAQPPPAAPSSGQSTPPSTLSGSGTSPSGSSSSTAAHAASVSPTGGSSAPSGGGGGTSSSLGAGGTPP